MLRELKLCIIRKLLYPGGNAGAVFGVRCDGRDASQGDFKGWSPGKLGSVLLIAATMSAFDAVDGSPPGI
jgi:hypothetical protein